MKCKVCLGVAVKNGRQKSGKQRYYCKTCKKSIQRTYTYRAYGKNINNKIYKFLIEGVGISSTSRLLCISKTTVLKRIQLLASKVKRPLFTEKHQSYEIDEMRVVLGNKQRQCWLTYAINRNTKQVINFVIGRRTKENISEVVNSVLELSPKYVYTDKLITYRSLIPNKKHDTRKRNTTIIERNNLTLRISLKRLSRKTICYSKSYKLLESCIRLYFWRNSIVC